MGFFNIIENVKNFKIKNFFYASSSSVYGDLTTFPLKEDFNLKYKNIYALTKNVNEKISEIYQKFYKVRSVGLRFFTVYGEFGRPDMFMMKYILSIKYKKLFSLYNYGNHYRDFTYVGDVVNILVKLLKCKLVKNNEIFNVCSSNPQKITKIIKLLNKKFNTSPNIKKIKFQDADVLKTFGSNLKIRKVTKFVKFTPIKEGIEKLSNWAKFYYKI